MSGLRVKESDPIHVLISQEHVAIIETEVYELMIFRDIHKYHI